MVNVKYSRPIKALSVASLVGFTYWMYISKKNAFDDAMRIISGYHAEIMTSIERDTTSLTSGLTYDDMVKSILNVLDGFSDEISQVPALLNTFTEDLLGKIRSEMEGLVEIEMEKFRLVGENVTTNVVPRYIDQLMEDLDVKFQEAVGRIGSDDEIKEINDYYNEMTSTMRERFSTEISDTISKNTESRISRTRDFSTVSIYGVLETYRRLIDVSKKISSDFMPNNQARNFIISDIETRVSAVFTRVIKYDMFEAYASGEDSEVTDEFVDSLISDNFNTATEIRNGVRDEIEFRVSLGHVSNLLKNRASQIYLSTYENVSSDKLMTDDQKRDLYDFSKKMYDDLLSFLNTNQDNNIYTVEELTSYSSEYLSVILPEVQNYTNAIFTEFKSVLTRARLEGTQTCILQFFEMRRAMDYEFFFSLAEEEGFDMDKTAERFNALYEDGLSTGRERMVTLARMPHVVFLYDDSFDFLSSLSEILFFTDNRVRSTIDELTTDFHDKLADSIAVYMDKGIEDSYDEEAEESKDVVLSVYKEFTDNMEVIKVSNLVDEVKNLLTGEIALKVDTISNLLPELVDDFKTETTEPFTEEWMIETQQKFITDDDTDYDGMKRYVVQEMNVVGEAVATKYRQILAEFIDVQIVSIGDILEGITGVVLENIQASPLGIEEKQSLEASLESTIVEVRGTISSVNTSIQVNVNGLLQGSIRSLDVLMDIMTQNFFNTTLQVIVDDFQKWAQTTFTEMYFERMENLAATQKALANSAKEKYEKHVNDLVDVEIEYRQKITERTMDILNTFSQTILNDYNIVSYNARRGILLNTMKNEVATKGLTLRRERSDKIWQLEKSYEQESLTFKNTYARIAREKIQEFNDMYSSEITRAYERSADVLGTVGPTLKILEGTLRQQYTVSYEDAVSNVIATKNNDLPPIDMVSVCYSPGLLGIADKYEGDLPSIMLPYMIVQEFNSGGSSFFDGESIEDETSQELSTLGESNDGELSPHERIILSLSNFESWEKKVIDDTIAELEITMDQRLKENTCTTKPTCADGSTDCGDTEKACREGYVMKHNSHGILCCSFAPAQLGFSVKDTVGLLATEIAWSLAASPDGIGFAAKMVRSLGAKVGTKAASMAKSLGVFSKLSKSSGMISKATAKVGKKLASKTGYKAGMKMGTKLGTKFAAKIGLKVGKKIGAKVATKVVATLLKSSLKIAATGPIGAAMFVFDVLSLLADLWDPSGYNNAQAAGEIEDIMKNIKEQYEEMLKEEGITSPLLSDVLYNIDPEYQGEFTQNLVIDWFTDSLSKFSSANEARWNLMPTSETILEYDKELERLSDVMDTDINFIQKLLCSNTENTFMVKSSTINGTDPSVVGTSSDLDYDSVDKIHLQQCSLNSTGIVASNSFAVQKTEFINEIVVDPLYRWVKIQTGFKVYSDLTSSELSKAEEEITRRTRLQTEGTISQAELDTPTIVKIGWSLEKIDPEREFWKQYTYQKEEGLDSIPTRSKLINAWNKDKRTREKLYTQSIEAIMAELLVDMVPCDELTGICDTKGATVEQVRNQDSSSPDWYPSYSSLYQTAKNAVDDNINDILEEERLVAITGEALTKSIAKRADEKVAEETGVTVEEATLQRVTAVIEAESVQWSPDFSVYKDGYGQSSPLFSIKETCDEMEYGVEFDQVKGLCEFTREYCKRYGLTYFYNEDVGVHDCKLAGSQKFFETIFGTTVTRGVKRLYGTPMPVDLGMSGSQYYEDVGVNKPISSFETAVELDKLGLGAKFSIWD